MYVRTFHRYCRKYEAEGSEGLCDKRLNKAAHNAASTEEAIEILSLFQTRYANFTVSHFYDKYRQQQAGQRSYNWVRKKLQSHGMVKKLKNTVNTDASVSLRLWKKCVGINIVQRMSWCLKNTRI